MVPAIVCWTKAPLVVREPALPPFRGGQALDVEKPMLGDHREVPSSKPPFWRSCAPSETPPVSARTNASAAGNRPLARENAKMPLRIGVQRPRRGPGLAAQLNLSYVKEF